MTPPSPLPIVDVHGLRAGYGAREIISGISFSVPRGRIVAIIGGSGCGKTTVIRTLVGLLKPTAGDIRVFGQDPHQLDEEERRILLGRIGMLYQAGALLGSLTVGQNIALPLKHHTALPDEIIHRIVERKLEMVGLSGTAQLMPSELSGGMRKRASLSRALALDPELLLCDEPSSGLDPIVAAGIDETLRHLQSTLEMTMIVVTHELASIALIADHVIMLADGKILAQGTVDELRHSDDPLVRDFFARKPPATRYATEENLLGALTEATA